MATPPGKTLRRSLTHVGGVARFRGDEALRELMTRAAEPASQDSAEGAERALTHGFHAWPGRLHPFTARALIAAAPPGLIADPFMGAGTVPLEAMLAGRAALGNDLNPIGVEVAWVRTRRFSPGALLALAGRARAVAKKALVLAADGPDATFRAEVGRWFDAQALAEVWALARCLRDGDPAWQGSPSDPLTRVLRMVLSSIVVKASRQVSDSVTKLDRRPLEATPPGRVAHWFKKRAQELASQLAALSAAVPKGAPEPRLMVGDARAPPLMVGDARVPPAEPIAAIVSSPPYPGVYDYLTHHALRCAVLGLSLGAATDHEIGSRRASERLGKSVAHARYISDLGQVLHAWSATLMTDGFVALIIGDGQVGQDIVRVMPLLEEAAGAAGLSVRAVLSQARPTFGPAREAGPKLKLKLKEEHLVWLTRARAVSA